MTASDWLPAAVAVVVAAVPAWLAFRASQTATRIESTKVDADAYDRARRFDQEVTAGLRQELRSARDEIAALRTTLDAERRDHDRESRDLRAHVDRLERIVARLTRRLRDAGLDVSDPA